jgi:hypothetical protein
MIKNIMLLIYPDGKLKGSWIYNNFIRRVSTFFLQIYFSRTKCKSVSENKSNDLESNVIISLTSFGDRVGNLHLCFESLFRQSTAPSRIVLWLAEDEYCIETIPDSLKKFIYLGLEIRFCEDLRSHKKYYYTLKLWPDSIIVTVDDDVYYPEDMLEKLIHSYQNHPQCISCYRAHLIRGDESGILPYVKWGFASPGDRGPSHKLMAVGVGGVLYPPGSLHPDVLDKYLLKRFCFYADDIWLKLMAFRMGTKIVKVNQYSKTLISTSNELGYTLSDENVLGGKNDIQLKETLAHFNMDGLELLENKL